MTSNRRRDTQPEIAVRRLLHARGLRFRVDYPIRTSERTIRVDIAFPRAKLAILIDGCFWHGCPEHGTMPKHNRDYWEPKIARNRERDLHQTGLLSDAGWQPLRFWTHEGPDEISDEVLACLGAESPVRARPPAQ
jgi:DNA mismatch endonuclease, patch repair protein